MKTEKIITSEDLNEVMNDEKSMCLFYKTNTKLFVDVIPKNKQVSFSVCIMSPYKEEKFDLLNDAVGFYNSL